MALILRETIMESRRMNLQANVIDKHCFIQGNHVADVLAKYYLYRKYVLIYYPNDLPKDASGMYTIDAIVMPCLRHAKNKKIMSHYL